MAPQPRTPTKRSQSAQQVQLKMRDFMSKVQYEWNIALEMPGESPSKGSGRSLSLEESWEKFDVEAHFLFNRWTRKPRADPDVTPEASHNPHLITPEQRDQLLQCLHKVLKEESEAVKGSSGSPSSFRSVRSMSRSEIDDSPVKFSLENGNDTTKRVREETTEVPGVKKVRRPDSFPNSGFLKPDLPQSRSTEDAMLPPSRMDLTATRSANTSFTSNTSSIFDRAAQSSWQPSTQDTAPDDDDEHKFKTQETRESFITPQTDKEEHYGSSSFDFENIPNVFPDVEIHMSMTIQDVETDLHVNNELSQLSIGAIEDDTVENDTIEDTVAPPNEKELRDRLQDVFCGLPSSLRSASFAVIYEITRVFLHAEVALTDQISFPDPSEFDDYDKLWRCLRDHPALKNRPFPEKCSKEAWSSTFSGFQAASNSVILCASLQFNERPKEPLFRFRLQPLRLDTSHRLDRRLGSDRFLEIDVPILAGRNVPKFLADLGERGREIIIEWLVDIEHDLFGRVWKPFYTRPKEKKDKRKDNMQSSDAAHRVYFFAIDGKGFQVSRDPLRQPRGPPHTTLSIDNLLNMIRPTRKNKGQSYLKLFSRTSLALSRNWATVTLERRQIIDRDDILCGSEVMTDGAGRISPTLALKVTQKLGLSFPPSGFQGRIGEAKGFWSVHYGDKTGIDWIEIYRSQRKWTRSKKTNGESDDESHRTFEVVGYSGPLHSKSLNRQFAPILIDRAKDPKAMRQSIEILLREGLAREVQATRDAMNNPQLFRKWLREVKPNVSERLRAQRVPQRAGLPQSIEEALNTLLENGFHPQKQFFIKDMARQVFKIKCNELVERLKITVGKSASIYMVPDFYGVLEPNEVYLDFSSFVDESSEFSGANLDGKDILVARSPAHFVSDIQRVTVVAKLEFRGMKDVIVFPTKGNPSLAAKLSGGDYDGDRAWVCWEPAIVNNFINADVPECEDLVKLGYIQKDSRTYEQLVEDPRHADASSVFLRESFAFHMRQSLLGRCTDHKDAVCFTQQSVSTTESIWLSTLLSSLVDEAKQGFSFKEDDWARFMNEIIKFKPRQPTYKNKELDRNSQHIINVLKCVATDTVEECLAQFHESIEDPPWWDDDLARQYDWAREKGLRNAEWKDLLDLLDADLTVLKFRWGRYWQKHRSKNTFNPYAETKPEFNLILDECFQIFVDIRPHVDTPHTQSLLPDCLPNPEQSEWALLKASALFASYRRNSEFSLFPWLMSGTQLCQLKAKYGGASHVHTVVSSMYVMLKPDNSYVKRLMSGNGGAVPDEDAGIANLDEDSEVED